MTDIVRGTSRTSTEPLSSAPEHVGQGSLRLGHDDIRVQSSTEHVAPSQAPVSHKRVGGQVRELAQRPPPQLASLRKSSYWERDSFIEKGGWVTPAGLDEPVTGAASLCVGDLLEAKLPPETTATNAG